MSITVRAARSNDIPWLLEQLRAFARFFATERSLFPTDDVARGVVAGLVARHPFHVAVDDGAIANNEPSRVGFIAGALGPHPYNADIRMLTEMFWWVAPAYRGSRAGALLFNVFLEEGRRRGAHWVIMTLEAESPIDDRVLLKRGFRLKERSYLLEFAEAKAQDQAGVLEVSEGERVVARAFYEPDWSKPPVPGVTV